MASLFGLRLALLNKTWELVIPTGIGGEEIVEYQWRYESVYID